MVGDLQAHSIVSSVHPCEFHLHCLNLQPYPKPQIYVPSYFTIINYTLLTGIFEQSDQAVIER